MRDALEEFEYPKEDAKMAVQTQGSWNAIVDTIPIREDRL